MNKKTMKLMMGLLPLILVCNIVLVNNINGAITYDEIRYGYYDEPIFVDYWGGIEDEKYVYSAVDSNSYLTIVCQSNSFGSSDDIYIVKFDQNMNYKWNSSWTISDSAKPVGIIHDDNNNIYVAGQVITELPGPEYINDVFVLKFNSNGSLLWDTIHLDINNDELPTGLTLDTNGNIYVAGSTNSSNGSMFIHKFNNNGVLSDTYYYGNTNPFENLEVGKIFSDFSGDLYIAATTNNTQPLFFRDQVLVKMNSTTGIAYWNVTYGGISDFDKGFDVAVSGESAYMTGYYYNNVSSSYEASIVCINTTTGSILWSNEVDYDIDYSIGVTVNDYGNPLITGLTNAFDPSYDIFVIEFNQTGSILWNTTYSTTVLEDVNDIDAHNKLLYIVGSQYIESDGTTDVFILTFDDYVETFYPTIGPYGRIFGIIFGILGLSLTGLLIVVLVYTYWKK
ncbi:MAG: hypothetical protein FK731_07020 [Asgard group archaeon]|nr:hypothetical protein [Asgard group archaeon]